MTHTQPFEGQTRVSFTARWGHSSITLMWPYVRVKTLQILCWASQRASTSGIVVFDPVQCVV